jgi:hypothetical protein
VSQRHKSSILDRRRVQQYRGCSIPLISYIYADLGVAEIIVRKEEGWLSSAFVMPGGIVHDVQKGHELSTTRQQTFVSFLDVAAGVQCADEGERWDGAHTVLFWRMVRSPGLSGGSRFIWSRVCCAVSFLCYTLILLSCLF